MYNKSISDYAVAAFADGTSGFQNTTFSGIPTSASGVGFLVEIRWHLIETQQLWAWEMA